MDAPSLDRLKISPEETVVVENNDLTDTLRRCAAEMQPGQLIHAPGFDLWAALSAVELMNPVMDSGMRLQVNDCMNTGTLFQGKEADFGERVAATLGRLFQAEVRARTD